MINYKIQLLNQKIAKSVKNNLKQFNNLCKNQKKQIKNFKKFKIVRIVNNLYNNQIKKISY